ncbi:hypothetical protein CF126_03410 [Aeromonas dhakensis]|nr:hypothetical protein CF126_03410 [Aeromonas dhakensis]
MSVFNELYYVDSQAKPNGDNEIHKMSCPHLPLYYLGLFPNGIAAIKAAEKLYPQVNGCVHCCKHCHISR